MKDIHNPIDEALLHPEDFVVKFIDGVIRNCIISIPDAVNVEVSLRGHKNHKKALRFFLLKNCGTIVRKDMKDERHDYLDEALLHPEDWVVKYDELGEDEPVCLSVQEAVRRARVAIEEIHTYSVTDKEALEEFLTVYWAWLHYVGEE